MALAAGTGFLVDRGYGAARTRLGDPERHATYPEPAPAVFGVGPAALTTKLGLKRFMGRGSSSLLLRFPSEASEIKRNANPSAKLTWSLRK